jgi:DNA (cytosine-5)-methyltransferase 1
LGSNTASDKTSQSAGDIEIFRENELFEVLEIKLDKQIDANMLRIVEQKILKYNPKRYYLLSHFEINKEEKSHEKITLLLH